MTNGDHRRDETYTLYFRVDEESIEQLLIPELRYGCSHVASYVGESNSHLHLVEGDSKFNRFVNVHEIATDYSGWFVKYQVDLSH